MASRKGNSSTKKTAALAKAGLNTSSSALLSTVRGRNVDNKNRVLRGMARRPSKRPHILPSPSPYAIAQEQNMNDEESWELLLAGTSDHTVFLEHRLAGRCPGIPVEDLDGILLEDLVKKIELTVAMVNGELPPVLFAYTARQLMVLINILHKLRGTKPATPATLINSWWKSDALSSVKIDALPLDVQALARKVNYYREATVDPDARLSETLKHWMEEFQEPSRHIIPRGFDILKVFDNVRITEEDVPNIAGTTDDFMETCTPICFSWAFFDHFKIFRDDLVDKICQTLPPVYPVSWIQQGEVKKIFVNALAGYQPSPRKWKHVLSFNLEEKQLICNALFRQAVDFTLCFSRSYFGVPEEGEVNMQVAQDNIPSRPMYTIDYDEVNLNQPEEAERTYKLRDFNIKSISYEDVEREEEAMVLGEEAELEKPGW